jgi:hypothetical protein
MPMEPGWDCQGILDDRIEFIAFIERQAKGT